MALSEADLHARISTHAVLRYVERVLGVVLEPRDGESDASLARRSCLAASTTTHRVRLAILTKAVRYAIEHGLGEVFCTGFCVRIVDGTVMTVNPRLPRPAMRELLRGKRERLRRNDRAHRASRRAMAGSGADSEFDA